MSSSVTSTTSQSELSASSRGRRSDRLPSWTALVAQTFRSPRMLLGSALLAFVVLVAVAGPLAAPHTPSAFVGIPLQGPSGKAPLGTDYLGQDVLSRVLYGGRSVLWMSFAATTLAVAVGTTVGLVAAYSGGWVDSVLMRVNDVVLAFPGIVLALLFVSIIGPKPWLIVVLVAAAYAPPVTRTLRGAALTVIHQEYVQSAEALGVPRWRILQGDVLPHVVGTMMVEFGVRLTWSIAFIAGLSFLGLGIQPPNADWGLMISQNRSALTQQPWGVLAPIILIAIFAIGTNLVAESISRAIARVDGGSGSFSPPT